MISLEETRTLWSPGTDADRDLVRKELASILESSHFSHSKRYPALLIYVVEETLKGKADRIKERSLGVEVFNRPADYDTNSDTVVRYTAGEIRKRLALYYHEKGGGSAVQIVMPTGSYVPEFYRTVTAAVSEDIKFEGASVIPSMIDVLPARESANLHLDRGDARVRNFAILAVVGSVLACLLVFAIWSQTFHRQTALDRFWVPVLGDRNTPVLISSGSVVFDPNHFSGTATADRSNVYPFVSMQMVASIARLSGLIERRGAEYKVDATANTTITDMRERPLILVGAYNNPWTLRLLTPLRFSFSPEPKESIVDREHADVHWSRDRSLPYSSADDFALFARFRDATTDSTVVVVAGLGRNGTEAAAQFITSPHYMRLLEERVGHDLSRKNIEVVLKVNVVDGKTGAPSIESVHVW